MRFSIGRTDFPTGNLAEMRASLSRLAALEGEYLVYPGHGGPTTLQKRKEKQSIFRTKVIMTIYIKTMIFIMNWKTFAGYSSLMKNINHKGSDA